MSPEPVQPKLTTILAADVEGYTRLMRRSRRRHRRLGSTGATDCHARRGNPRFTPWGGSRAPRGATTTHGFVAAPGPLEDIDRWHSRK